MIYLAGGLPPDNVPPVIVRQVVLVPESCSSLPSISPPPLPLHSTSSPLFPLTPFPLIPTPCPRSKDSSFTQKSWKGRSSIDYLPQYSPLPQVHLWQINTGTLPAIGTEWLHAWSIGVVSHSKDSHSRQHWQHWQCKLAPNPDSR